MNKRNPDEYRAVEEILNIYCREGAAANVEGVKKGLP